MVLAVLAVAFVVFVVVLDELVVVEIFVVLSATGAGVILVG